MALEVWRRDPVGFIRTVLASDLWSTQQEICNSVRDNRTTAVASCHSIGKSYLSARVALWFLCNFPGSIVITTAPTARQVKKILWAEIASALAGARYKLVRDDALTTTELKIAPKWFAVGFTATDATRFQGFHAPHMLVIGDEAAGLDETVFTGMDAVLSGGQTHLLLVGNPTDPQSQFAKYFTMEGVRKFNVSAFDTPNFTEYGITREDIRKRCWREKITGKLPYPSLVTPEWVAEKHAQWCGGTELGETNPLWCARVEGKFPASARDQLIPLQWIVDAQERSWEGPVKDLDDQNLIAADIARMGGDEIVLGHRRGSWFRIKDAFTHALLTETAGRITQLAREAGTKQVRGDVIGVGGGALDICRENGLEVTDINVAMAATEPERFQTFRDEMYWQARDRLNPELGSMVSLDPLDDRLAGQLASIKYKVQGNGKIKVESKDEMKARGLPSPDRADCFAIAFCTPPAKPFGFFLA